jgi:predicted phage terminase large subunit-like protein
VVFGHLDGPNDHYQYQGAAFHFVGADEVTELRWNQVMFLFSRLRKGFGDPLPLRFRSASNPGGRSHMEVFNRYVNPKTREDRVFIPSSLEDNPHLDRESYELSLNQLDPVTRMRLRYGDWMIHESQGMFKPAWFEGEGRVVPALPTLPSGKQWRFVRWWDVAATEVEIKKNKDPDWSVGVLVAFCDGIGYVVDVVRVRMTPMQVEQKILDTAEHDGPGVEIWMEQEPGAAGKTMKNYYSRLLAGYSFQSEVSNANKLEYAKPLASAAEHGNIRLVRGSWNYEFIEELCLFPSEGERIHDDQVDAVSKAWIKVTIGRKRRIRAWG